MAKSLAALDLIQDTAKTLSRTRRDTYDTASRLRTGLNVANTHPAHIAAQARAYGTVLITTLDRINSIAATIEASCLVWDADYAAMVVDYNAIRQAGVAMRDAAIDGSNVQSRLDAIIAGLPRGTVL